MSPHARIAIVPSLVALLALGCAGAPAPSAATPAATPPAQPATAAPMEAPAPAAETAAAPAADAAPAPAAERRLPTECVARKDGLCTPPREFVQRLCSGAHPDVALAMFGKSTPWKRAYASRDVEAWNASGGRVASDAIAFEEEVLVLAHRGGGGGAMQVSGSESYDVLRWDGTCASLMSDELTMKRPAQAKYAKIPWRRLDASVRDALARQRHIGKLDSERRKECKGAAFGAVTPECSRVDERLSGLVVEYIRSGGPVPPPESVP